jgi:CheY-like chemotaxis protein
VPVILIVEDYEPMRRGIARLLREAGFRTAEAANGIDALAYLLDGGRADAVVLDLVMPEMSGWQFLREKQRDSWLADIPVIVLSGLDGRSVGGLIVAATLRKPIQPKALVDAVRTACARPFRRRRLLSLPRRRSAPVADS